MGARLARRSLGRHLEQARRTAGKSRDAVSDAGVASVSKLQRIESGKTSVRVGDVLALCRLYGVPQSTTDALADMATQTRDGRGWWEDFSASPDWFSLYVELEQTAKHICIWDPELVHGLFQTPDYLRALYRVGRPYGGGEGVDRQIKLRTERQQALHRAHPLHVTAVLGAGVLTREVGGPQVMKEQIAHLCDLPLLDHIDIRVLPWNVGAHAALHTGPFTILTCGDGEPDIVYREGHTGAHYLEKLAELEAYRGIFDLILQQSIPIREYVAHDQ